MTKHQLRIFSASVFAAFVLLYSAASVRSTSYEVSDLEDKVNDLENQVSGLESKVDDLENELEQLRILER